MCGVIVVDAGRSRSTRLGRDAYIHDRFLEYRHNYALLYQFPNSNLFTHRMLFSREKPLLNTMAWVYFYHIKNPKNALPNFTLFILFVFLLDLFIQSCTI